MSMHNYVSRETSDSKYDHIINQIKENLAQNKAVHAYMFEGGRADTRLELAMQVCRLIMCQNNSNTKGVCCSDDDVCSACRKIINGTHPDVVIAGDKLTESGYVSVETARDIKKQSYLLPNEADKRVFVIKNADKLNLQAQNALLKIFEEPPKDVIFMLLCRSKSGFLPTTLSRMIVYKLKGDEKSEISKEVSTKYKIAPDSLQAQAVAGYIEAFGEVDFDQTVLKHVLQGYEISEKLLMSDTKQRLLAMLPKEREALIITLNVISLAVRDLMCLKNGVNECYIFQADIRHKQTAGKFSSVKLMSLFDKLCSSTMSLQKYANVNAILGELSQIVL